jgi:hypothetical protein
MHTSDRVASRPRERARSAGMLHRGASRGASLARGGTDGNKRLTAITGVILLVLLAVIGVTILRIRQLISVHLFLGLLLIGPVALKLASTGYRFVRYYTGNADYRSKGPPEIILRAIAPVVVLSTVAVLVSGVVLLFQGRAHRDPMLLIHKVSFIVWIVFTGLHVLGHVPGLGGALRARSTANGIPGVVPGRGGRSVAVVGALVGGLVLAIVLLPAFHGWTNHLAGFHGH